MADGTTNGGGLPEYISIVAPDGIFAHGEVRDTQTGEPVLTVERIQLDWHAGGVINATVTAVVGARGEHPGVLIPEREPGTNRAKRVHKFYPYPRLRLSVNQGKDTPALASE